MSLKQTKPYFKKRFKKRCKERGAGLVEYGLLAALISVVCIKALMANAEGVNKSFCLPTVMLSHSTNNIGNTGGASNNYWWQPAGYDEKHCFKNNQSNSMCSIAGGQFCDVIY